MTVSEYKDKAGGLAVTPATKKRILNYQKRRDKRLKDRGLVLVKNKFDFFRTDADDDNNQNNESEDTGSHGNTRLPFGLCKRFGIEVGADWTPRDAWDALKGKGVTPEGAYEKLEKGEDPATPSLGEEVEKAFEDEAVEEVSKEISPPKSKIVMTKGPTGEDVSYEIEKAVSGSEEGLGEKTWALSGAMLDATGKVVGGGDLVERFTSKEAMYRWLKEQGVEEFEDPETGEIVNPKEMDFPPKKTFSGKGYHGMEYGDLFGRPTSDRREPWELRAKGIEGTKIKRGFTAPHPAFGFKTKEDMMYWLREHGIEEFQDPETGEIVNPMTMDLPERLLKSGRVGFKDLVIGMRDGKYTVTGSYLDGRKTKIMELVSLKAAQEWLEGQGVDLDKVKLSPSLKKREAERVSWLSSDKKEYVTGDGGVKYGDLEGTKDEYYPYRKWYLRGEDEEGKKETWVFGSKAEMMKFMKDQGCEKVRIGKERVNPMEYEVPPSVGRVRGKDYQEFGLSFAGDMPYLYGIDLDDNEDTLDSPGYGWTVQKFLETVKERYGIDESSLTMTDEAKKKLEEVKKKDEEREKARKEFESKAVTIGSDRYVNPRIKKVRDGDYKLVGEGRDGDTLSITPWGSWGSVEKRAEKFGLSMEDLVKDDLREEYEKYKERKERFESEGVELDGYKVLDPFLFLDSDGTWAVKGYDIDGDELTVSPWSSAEAMDDWCHSMGLNPKDIIKDDKAKQEWESFEKTAEEYDKGAVEIGSMKLLKPHIEKTAGGSYRIVGTTRGGKTQAVGARGDLYDIEDQTYKLGTDINSLLLDDEIKEDFKKYKKAREEFDKKAIEIGDGKYVDCEVRYDPRNKVYAVMGRDSKGREKSILIASDWQGMQGELDRYPSGSSVKLSDVVQKRKEKALKVKELVDSGDYFSFGDRDNAYTDMKIERDGDEWKIYGTDVGGDKQNIKTANTWDEAVSEMEKHGVKKYGVMVDGEDIGKPRWGMHKVMLMRKPEGGYIVFADSKKYGDHAVMYEDPKEENARRWLKDNGIPPDAIKTRGMNPNDDKPRTHTAKSLEGFDEHRMKKADETPFLSEMSDKMKMDVANMLTDIFDVGEYRMRRKGHFEDIFDGRFKTLLETGTSGGSSFKPGRRETGVESFGHDYDIKSKDSEKYGYLGVPDDEEALGYEMASWYGDTVYKFKKDRVKDRVTYALGDTLDADRPIVGYAGDYPTIEGASALDCWGGGKEKLKKVMDYYKAYKRGEMSFGSALNHMVQEMRDRYIETHFHGDLTLADVASITFPMTSRGEHKGLKDTFSKMTPEKRQKVVDFCRANDIKLQYYERGDKKIRDAYEYLEKEFGVK